MLWLCRPHTENIENSLRQLAKRDGMVYEFIDKSSELYGGTYQGAWYKGYPDGRWVLHAYCGITFLRELFANTLLCILLMHLSLRCAQSVMVAINGFAAVHSYISISNVVFWFCGSHVVAEC